MKLKTYFRTVFLLFFFTVSLLFASGSWQGEVSLSDNSVPVDSSLVASIINLQYIPSDPVIKQELDDGKATISYEYVWTFSPGGQIESGQGTSSCKGKFTTTSSTLDDKTVSVNVTVKVIYLENSSVVDSDSHNFYAHLTVFTISISANHETICAGGDGLEICKTELVAKFTPDLEGKTIDFTIVENNLGESLDNGTLSASSALTDENGEAMVTLTSSSYSSNSDEDPPVDFKVMIEAKYKSITDTVEIQYMPSEGVLNIFLDPNTETPLEYLIADGESQAKNKIHISYDGENIPEHTINWSFRFWTFDTLGEDFFDLTPEEQESVLNTASPDYEGTGTSPYGSITSSSETNSSGIASSTYTAGTVAGIIEFVAADTHINPIWRGSWITNRIIFWRKKQGKEKLKLRVWTDFIDTEIKNYLRNPFLEFFSSSRFEWVFSKFTTFGVNKFNVNNDCGAGWATGHMASYNSQNIKVYWYKIESSYWEQQKKRCGYTAAHEIGHVMSSHHSNCLMVSTPTDLLDNCQSFCVSCRNKFKKLYGE